MTDLRFFQLLRSGSFFHTEVESWLSYIWLTVLSPSLTSILVGCIVDKHLTAYLKHRDRSKDTTGSSGKRKNRVQDAQTRLVAASEEVAVVCAVPWRCSQLLPFSRDSWKEQMHAPPLLHDWIDSAELKVGRDRGCSRTDTPTNKMLTVESNYALTEHRS